MRETDEFDELAREFQSAPAASGPDLVERVKRVRRRAAASLALGSAIAVGLAVLAIRVLWRDRDAAAVAFAALEIGVPAVLITRMWRERRRLLGAAASTTRAFLELEIERCEAELRLGTFLFRAAPYIALGLIVFQLLVLRRPGLRIADAPFAATVGFAGPYVILAAVLLFTGRRRRRFERLRADFEERLRTLTGDVD
jgi:hypothetical protein